MREFERDPYAGRSREFRLDALVTCVNALKFDTDHGVKEIRKELASNEPLPKDVDITHLGIASLAADRVLGKLDEVEAALAGVFYSLRKDFVDPPTK